MEIFCVMAALAALFLGSAAFTLKARAPAGLAPLVTLSCIVAVLTLAGMAGVLYPAAWAVYALCAAGGVWALLPPKEGKKRVHVLAIGDVGSMLLTGLHLLGGDVISSIGICDISDKVTARWEFEENQIAYPWDYDAMPEVDVVDQDHLFDCDVFVFVASKGIPPVGSGVKDVRMYQFENNSKIIGHYAKMAREKNFKGLFCAVSDPVDPLAKTAFLESNKNEAGEYDWMGLLPEQIQGFGLGVMNARAAYYAKRDPRFKQFLTEGRSFGPHGQDLVIADSIENYNDELSKELTNLTVTANLHMRAIGYKPFVAPAFSSGAISILMTLRKQWHCGSVFLGGVYMGVKNRYTEHGLETETLALPDALYERIVFAAENLARGCFCGEGWNIENADLICPGRFPVCRGELPGFLYVPC